MGEAVEVEEGGEGGVGCAEGGGARRGGGGAREEEAGACAEGWGAEGGGYHDGEMRIGLVVSGDGGGVLPQLGSSVEEEGRETGGGKVEELIADGDGNAGSIQSGSDDRPHVKQHHRRY